MLSFQDRVRSEESPKDHIFSHAMTQGHRKAEDVPLGGQIISKGSTSPPSTEKSPNQLPSPPSELAGSSPRMQQRVFI